MKIKTIIAGSRSITDYQVVKYFIEKARKTIKITEVVSGHSPGGGVDLLGEQWAEENDIPIKLFPFLFHLGKKGGMIRNKNMARYADAAVIIWDGESRGSENMILNSNVYLNPKNVFIYNLKKDGVKNNV